MITQNFIFIAFITFSIGVLIGIYKNKKNLAIACLFLSVATIIIGQMLGTVFFGYRESSWEKLTKCISREIENGNEEEIKKGIDHVHENYSDFYSSKTYMGYKYKKKIEELIATKKETNKSKKEQTEP